MIDREKIGRQLRDYRLLHDLSVEELAELLGVVPKTVEKWERGTSEPQAINFYAIKKLLDSDRGRNTK